MMIASSGTAPYREGTPGIASSPSPRFQFKPHTRHSVHSLFSKPAFSSHSPIIYRLHTRLTLYLHSLPFHSYPLTYTLSCHNPLATLPSIRYPSLRIIYIIPTFPPPLRPHPSSHASCMHGTNRNHVTIEQEMDERGQGTAINRLTRGAIDERSDIAIS